jgi:hypothetical protein
VTNAVRAAWLALAVVPDALHVGGASAISAWVVWVAWSLVALSVLLPHPLSLTTARFVASLLLVHSAWELADARGATSWGAIVGFVIITAVTATLFSSTYGATHAQAAAYGHERRHLLRPPVSVILPVVLLWILVATAAAVAVHATSPIDAAVAAAILVVLLGFSLRRGVVLARRWLVFVPAGIAVHDPLVLRDTFMVRSHDIRALQRATDATEAFDATCTTWGDPLELVLSHPHDVSLSQFGARVSRTLDRLHVTSLLVAPSRPNDALAHRT